MKERMERNRKKPLEGKAWDVLFGQAQFEGRES
jgi:hypothetical protein